MGINSISQYQKWTSSYSLLGAMNSAKRMGQMGVSSGYTPISPVSRTQKAAGTLSSESLSFVKDYQKNMSGLLAAAGRLKDGSASSVTRDMTVASSDQKVADAAASYAPTQAASYTLNVKQLATAQANISDPVDAAGSTLAGSLTIQTEGGAAKTFQVADSAVNNADILTALAKEINQSKLGVTAGVSLKDGKASLSLVGDKTGESGAFQVSGSLAASAGLSTPYAKAQNAVYTVKQQGSYAAEKEYTSETNSVYVDPGYRIKAQFKGTGTAAIGVAPNMAKTADAVQDLVDSFNSTLKLLNDNADRGVGVLNQMKRMLTTPTSDKSMAKIGIISNTDGTLSFDRTAFAKASGENLALVKDVLSGSFGVADGYANTAQRGLNTSSSSLLSEDLREARLAAAYNNPASYATYNRNGAYNNYSAMNVLMNLMV